MKENHEYEKGKAVKISAICNARFVLFPLGSSDRTVFIWCFILTLTDWNGVSSVKNFVGLKNFAAMARMLSSGALCTYFQVCDRCSSAGKCTGILIAYLLTRGFKGQNFSGLVSLPPI